MKKSYIVLWGILVLILGAALSMDVYEKKHREREKAAYMMSPPVTHGVPRSISIPLWDWQKSKSHGKVAYVDGAPSLWCSGGIHYVGFRQGDIIWNSRDFYRNWKEVKYVIVAYAKVPFQGWSTYGKNIYWIKYHKKGAKTETKCGFLEMGYIIKIRKKLTKDDVGGFPSRVSIAEQWKRRRNGH